MPRTGNGETGRTDFYSFGDSDWWSCRRIDDCNVAGRFDLPFVGGAEGPRIVGKDPEGAGQDRSHDGGCK